VDVRQVELAIDGSERIAELLAEEGDRITSGQLLAKLDTEKFELAVALAQAQVDMQQQVVDRLEAGSRPEEIAKARADVEAAQAIAKDAKREYDFTLNVSKSGSATQKELDDTLGAYEAAAAHVKAVQAVLQLAVLGPRQEDKNEARAVLKRYEVELAQAKRDLKDASLYAPSDGVVQERILEMGDMASPQRPVYTVALIDPVWVRAYVCEPDLGKIHEGMTAHILSDSFPNKRYEGWIGFISPTAEFTPKPVETRELRTKLVYEIRVFAKNPNNELRLGMPATVNIALDQSPRTVSGDDRHRADGGEDQVKDH